MTEKHRCKQIYAKHFGSVLYPCDKVATNYEGGRWWCDDDSPSRLLDEDKKLSLWQKQNGITGVEWQRKQTREFVQRKLSGKETFND